MEAVLATLIVAVSGFFAVVYASNAWLKAQGQQQRVVGTLYAELLERIDRAMGAMATLDFTALASALDALTERIKPVSRSGGTEPMPANVRSFIEGWPESWARDDQMGRARELYAETGNWSGVLMTLQKESSRG